MDTEKHFDMLNLTVRPAFCVKDGIILGANQPAIQKMITVGTPVSDFITTGAEDYKDYAGGCLYLTLTVSGVLYNASVRIIDQYHIFILEQDEDNSELEAMALAARELRDPLSKVMTIADKLFPLIGQQADSDVNQQIARINRGLFQMLRVIGNMSDAVQYASVGSSKQETMDICIFLEEIFQRAHDLISTAGISLTFQNLPDSVYCLVDAEKLERAIYNILSNCLKFTPPGGKIQASLTRRNQRLFLCIQDNGFGMDPSIRSTAHARFQRSPAVEDGRYGIGLGMVLIRSAAALHGGTVLIDQPDSGGTRVTMTLEIRQSHGNVLRSNCLRIDYAGERDHGLIEFSENLPVFLFEQDKIN